MEKAKCIILKHQDRLTLLSRNVLNDLRKYCREWKPKEHSNASYAQAQFCNAFTGRRDRFAIYTITIGP